MNPGWPRLLVMIPALNEEDTIAAVVADARKHLSGDVLVIDDGSSDRTAPRATDAGATVLQLPYNLGVGGALRTALRYAADHRYNRVVQLDGDGQHDAREARRLLAELERGGYDVVVGSRFAAGYEVGRSRRVTMRVLSSIVSRRLGGRITDTTSGFRAMGPRAIDLFSRLYPVDYLSDTVEALLLAGSEGLRVAEIDVAMHPRQGGVPSSPGLKGVYHLTRLMLAIGLNDHVKPAGFELGHR
ncbi:MAG TPA: glycosyltransferase family 2 protein [Acidimicrobiia bacterium]|nr:glycosyltransferase family 2 protein [Acidimicrobiia bacterium]